LTIIDVVPRGIATFDLDTYFEDTQVGGLSGITYDAKRDVYYALSDDRGTGADGVPSRYYTIAIDISDGILDEGDVTILDVTFLRNRSNKLFTPGTLDPESIELARPGHLYISSEGDADGDPVIDPFVDRFNLNGKQNRSLTIPDKFLPDGFMTYGIRDNLAFESLTSTPDKRYLFTAVENALVQDGPLSTLTEQSPSRVLKFKQGQTRGYGPEFVYMVDPIPFDSDPPGIFADNGLVELQALDNSGTFLAMERSFAVGIGNTVRLFEISTKGATDVSDIDALNGATYTPMSKRQVADFEELGYDPDNLEGMGFGPGVLAGGYKPLIVVSDNNFNSSQTTQFILLGVKMKPAR
jgi:3-phytase/alkaline phosphatase D